MAELPEAARCSRSLCCHGPGLVSVIEVVLRSTEPWPRSALAQTTQAHLLLVVLTLRLTHYCSLIRVIPRFDVSHHTMPHSCHPLGRSFTHLRHPLIPQSDLMFIAFDTDTRSYCSFRLFRLSLL